jgi:hypothetical protein
MKGQFSLSGLLCLLVIAAIVTSCKRSDSPFPGGNAPLLKEWKITSTITPERSYLFYYNQQKTLDSVRLIENNHEITKIAVKYRNGRLDSVINYVNGGEIEGFMTAYQYNDAGKVTQFTYVQWEGGKIPFTLVFYYTYTGDIVTLTWNTIVNRFRFNNQQDVEYITYNGNIPFDATFTFDNNLNPLAAVKDWYLISALESYLLEYILSKHNSVLKNYTDGNQAHYKNTYDQRKRLIRKELVDPRTNDTQTFRFYYY